MERCEVPVQAPCCSDLARHQTDGRCSGENPGGVRPSEEGSPREIKWLAARWQVASTFVARPDCVPLSSNIDMHRGAGIIVRNFTNAMAPRARLAQPRDQ